MLRRIWAWLWAEADHRHPDRLGDWRRIPAPTIANSARTQHLPNG